MMGGLRILFNVFNIYGRGTYRRAFFFAKELVKEGEKVDILCSSKNQKRYVSEVDGVRIIALPNLFAGSIVNGYEPLNIMLRCLWAINKNYDIVHSFETRPSVLLSSLILKYKGAIWVVDWADWFGKGGAVEERENFFLRNLLRPIETFFENTRKFASGISAISNFLRERSILLGFPPQRVLYLPNGASPEEFQKDIPSNIKEALSLPIESQIIGYVGAAFSRDLELMMNAFEKVVTSCPNVFLLWVGNNSHTIITKKSKNVICTGYVSENILPYYLQVCDVFWLPLRKSNANIARIPLKLMDYLASGKPIIATKVGDIPNIIGDNQVGFLVDDNPQDIATVTIKLLSDEKMMREFGFNSLELVEKKYKWSALCSHLKEFYSYLLDQRI